MPRKTPSKTKKAAEATAAEEVKVEEVKEEAPKKTRKKASPKKAAKAKTVKEAEEVKVEEVKVEEVKEEAPKKPRKKASPKKTTKAKTVKEADEVKVEEVKVEEVKEEAPKKTRKRASTKKAAPKKTAKAKKEKAVEEVKEEVKEEGKVDEVKAEETVAETVVEETVVPEEAVAAEEVKVEEPVVEEPKEVMPEPRRSVAFIGSECYPFVKTGGLGDVMYALPKALVKQNVDVKVILPRYACIPQKWQEKMIYRGAFDMDLCADGRSFYVGIMEYVWDGVVYDFIDNQEFFTEGKPYTNLVDDIPKFCFFAKAALAALNYMDWIPDVIHCHDWQAALVPVYLRTLFNDTKLASAKTMLTIHNLRFQGIYNIETIKYWTNLPDYVFNKDAMVEKWVDANMLKGGLTYANMITTVSNTYAEEIQTEFYGEHLDAHLRYHSGKLRGIVNGIDVDTWNPATDPRVDFNYDITNVLEKKKLNKKALQEALGLEVDDHKFVIGLVSRLTNQKGLDLVNAIIPDIMDEHTQVVVLGTGDKEYEDSFRYYEYAYKGNLVACIMYDETLAHKIYAGADAFLVPSLFEPCGLTQLNSMHYGTIPIVRETGGLKDTVEPYNQFENTGNGFTFDRYEPGLLLDAINRAKTFYFTNRWCFDEMVQRNMAKDVSWEQSAKLYRDLYLELTA